MSTPPETEPTGFATSFLELGARCGVSAYSAQQWSYRDNFPPKTKKGYDVAKIWRWRNETFQRPIAGQSKKKKELSGGDTARLLKAKADKEEAAAELAILEAKLKKGNYGDLEDMNTFMSEFLNEHRRLLMRIPIDMAPSYKKDVRDKVRKDVAARLQLTLRQMRDWGMKVEKLRTVK